MFDTIKRMAHPKDALINAVIEKEWLMFDRVQNQGGRASCQDDARTFYVMRYSQFAAWPPEVLSSYQKDVAEAVAQGRNLLTEKYAYMMAYTAPVVYEEKIKPYLPMVSEKKQALVAAICEWLMADETRFAECYPQMIQQGCPLHKSDTKAVSVEHYMQGELKTYSLRTLSLFKQYLETLAPTVEGGLAIRIYKTMVSFYGYDNLEQFARQ